MTTTIIDNAFNKLKELNFTVQYVDYDINPLGINNNHDELVNFKIKEIPSMLFGLWYMNYGTTDTPNFVPVIFGEYLFNIDKFKPTTVSWTPNFDKFINRTMTENDVVNAATELTEFVNTPWYAWLNPGQGEYNIMNEWLDEWDNYNKNT